MLPANRRVKKKFFPKIINDGLFLHGENFYLKFLDKKDNLPTLFSFIVPVKVKKTSVGRHLIKRKMSAVIEKNLSSVKSGLFYLIFAKKDVSRVPYSKIEAEILSLLHI